MNKILLTTAGLSGLLLGTFVFSESAKALSLVSCSSFSPDISGRVTGSAQCQVAENVSQDFLETDPMTVNETPGFFGITDWTFGGKIGSNNGYTGNGTGTSGSYDFSSVASNWAERMLIFKSGNNDLVGYKLFNTITSGTWTNPFTDPPFDFPGGSTAQNVSHISVYYRTASQPVPEPLTILGTGLALGLGGLFKSKQKQKSEA